MESRGGEEWLRPSHPLHDERELGDQDEVTYAIAARLHAYALWNLLDCRDVDGVPLMTVVEWLRFIQARSQVDQDWMQAVDGLDAGGWLTIAIVGVYGSWRAPPEVLMGHVGVLTTTGSC